MECDFDVLVIGAGVVGLSTGMGFAEAGYTVGILEKNSKYGLETSSRNSEVLHSGIHYPAGSLKAKFCVDGNRLLCQTCEKFNLLHKKTGKLTVVSSRDELPQLEKLHEAGIANGVEEMRMLNAADVRRMLPDVECRGGLFTGTSGILNVHMLMDYLYHVYRNAGGLAGFNEEVVGVEKNNRGYTVYVQDRPLRIYTTGVLVNSAGLFSDRISGMLGIEYNLHWAKGDYFSLEQQFSTERLVYPLPGKDFLGIHLTPKIGGGLRAGPDIEYVTKKPPPYSNENEMSGYMVEEGKRDFFAREIKRYFPALMDDALVPEIYGIRPKLQGPGDGFMDFVIKEEIPGFINLVGIESPGLTSCLAIGNYVKDMVKNII